MTDRVRPIRVVVVDDHEVVLKGLRLALESERDMRLVGEARCADEALPLIRDLRPDVVLLDVRLGDHYGPEVCRRILAELPDTAVVMLTSYPQDTLVLQSLLAGAKGYVIKDVELIELKRMIRSVHKGNAVLDPKVTGHVISTMADPTTPADKAARRSALLSPSERQIVALVAEGLANKEIAARLGVSAHTVKDRLDRIAEALGIRSRVKIAVEALRRGLI